MAYANLEKKRANHRAWYARNKERVGASKRRDNAVYKQKRRELVRSFKDRPCMDCGKRYPSCVMQFDHRGDKEFDIGSDLNHVGLDRLLAEIAKCDVVCANCHAIRTCRDFHSHDHDVDMDPDLRHNLSTMMFVKQQPKQPEEADNP